MSTNELIPDGERAAKTYRYLRLTMIGVVVALLISILIERLAVDCWQTSISSYYYTPVRAIFVGALMAIGVCLVVIKGATGWEDTWLNLAGMLAPVVAVVPTGDVGQCWSVDPVVSPVDDNGDLAVWVVANIDNNVTTLLFVGLLGFVVALILTFLRYRDQDNPPMTGPLRVGQILTLALLAITTIGYLFWDSFNSRAHGFAAVALFVFLAFAVISNALQSSDDPDEQRYVMVYAMIAAGMVVGGVALAVVLRTNAFRILLLEAYEVLLFVAFWVVQTVQRWPSVDEVPPGLEIPARRRL